MQTRNQSNWKGKEDRAIKAKAFIEKINNEYKESIENSIKKTGIYDIRAGRPCQWYDSLERPLMKTPAILKQTTTNGALYELDNPGRTIILNFASYKKPGGRFLAGAMAQEEALCHTSTLYPVLSAKKNDIYYDWNNQHLNKGLYLDRALYSEDILFFDEKGKEYKANVITCAAPNNSIALDYVARFTPEENKKALLDRINFVRDICLNEKADTVILGAWGCGVFAQDPAVVAEGFREAFETTGITCIYAVPDDKNYNAFKDAFQKYDKAKTSINKDYDKEDMERE